MKKLKAIILTLALAFALAACGDGATPDANSTLGGNATQNGSASPSSHGSETIETTGELNAAETPAGEASADASQNLTEPADISSRLLRYLEDNPIDNAFAFFADEHREEVAGNTIFAYLYAWKWREEYLALARDLDDAKGYSPRISRGITSFGITNAAYGYGKARLESGGSAKENFENMARFYRIFAFDCLSQLAEHGIEAGFYSSEEDICGFLDTVNFAGNYDYENFDTHQLHEEVGSPDPMPAIAGISDEDIFFLHTEFGAVLSVRGVQRFYDWIYLTPRMVLPRLALSDYNGDGIEDLAVILYLGSGTGMAIEELHVLRLDDFGAYVCSVESMDIENLLRGMFYSYYESSAEEVVVRLDNQEIRIDVSEIPKEKNPYYRGEDFRSIIYFDENDGVLSVSIAIGIEGFDYAPPFDYIYFYSDLVFDESFRLSLANCRIERERW